MLCFPTCLLSCLMMGVLMLKYVVKMALMLSDLAASFRDMLLCFLVVCFLCFVKSKDRRCWVSVRANLVLHNISKSFRNLLWQNQSGTICVWTLWKRETQMHAYTWRHPCGGGKKTVSCNSSLLLWPYEDVKPDRGCKLWGCSYVTFKKKDRMVMTD